MVQLNGGRRIGSTLRSGPGSLIGGEHVADPVGPHHPVGVISGFDLVPDAGALVPAGRLRYGKWARTLCWVPGMERSHGDDTLAAPKNEPLAMPIARDSGPSPRRGRPELRGDALVSREEIVERCLGRADAAVVLFQAPSGYGKTTVLAQWADAHPQPTAWISLDGRDNDPSLLAGSLAAALDETEPVGEGVFAALQASGPWL